VLCFVRESLFFRPSQHRLARDLMIQETIIGNLKKDGFGLISAIKRLSQRYKC